MKVRSFSPKVSANKGQISHEATTSIFHVDTLLSGLRVLCHVEVDIFKRGSLSNLPVNSTDIGPLISPGDVNFEISNTAEKVVCINIPFILVSDVNIGGDDSQADEAGGSENCG